MSANRFAWLDLQPEDRSFQSLFSSIINDDSSNNSTLLKIQSRLFDAVNLLLNGSAFFPLMLIRCTENSENLSLLLVRVLQHNRKKNSDLYGGNYLINNDQILRRPVKTVEEPFASYGEVQCADWVKSEQLFGSVRIFSHRIILQPGLIHRANGGILLLSLRTVLTQPLTWWYRLKQIVIQKRFDWLSPEKTFSLPVVTPSSMPIQLKLVLCGESNAIAIFQEIKLELTSLAVYSEHKENLQAKNQEDISLWCSWVTTLAHQAEIPIIEADFWLLFLRESSRYSGKQQGILPLCSAWIVRQLHEY